MTEPRKLVVVQMDDGNEALYRDGELVEQEETIFACEIANHCDGVLVDFKFYSLEDFDEWPELLTDLPIPV